MCLCLIHLRFTVMKVYCNENNKSQNWIFSKTIWNHMHAHTIHVVPSAPFCVHAAASPRPFRGAQPIADDNIRFKCLRGKFRKICTAANAAKTFSFNLIVVYMFSLEYSGSMGKCVCQQQDWTEEGSRESRLLSNWTAEIFTDSPHLENTLQLSVCRR